LGRVRPVWLKLIGQPKKSQKPDVPFAVPGDNPAPRFDLGAGLCTPENGRRAADALRITAPQVERLEREIDSMNASLPPLDSLKYLNHLFVLGRRVNDNGARDVLWPRRQPLTSGRTGRAASHVKLNERLVPGGALSEKTYSFTLGSLIRLFRLAPCFY
jgi:hypothetical protein